MPDTVATSLFSRRITSLAPVWRTPSGFKSICTRPAFSVWFWASTPT